MAEYGEPLSQREIEVLEQLMTGATNRQIAQELVVSVNTVKVHLRNIFTKLGVESRTEATLVAIREGLVSVSVEEEIESPELATAESLTSSPQPEAPVELLPPLPWPKRLALLGSLMLVILVSVVTRPQSQATITSQNIGIDEPAGSDCRNPDVMSEDSDWRRLAPMITARSRFALVLASSGRLFAIGGATSDGVTGAVERYDPQEDRWTLLNASKPTRVSNIGAAAIDQWIYVPGGLTANESPTTVVDAYDLVNETWTQVAPLPHSLFGYALAVYQGEIYLFGGQDDRGYDVNTTYIYDPQQDSWREGKEMPTPRAFAAAATLGSQMFVVGGYDGQRELATCEMYSPATDAWATCEPLRQGRGGLGLAGVANRLYAVGGGWSNYLGSSERYSLNTAEWVNRETPMIQEWRNLAVASAPNKFYVAGGWCGDYLSGVWEYIVLPYVIYVPSTSQ